MRTLRTSPVLDHVQPDVRRGAVVAPVGPDVARVVGLAGGGDQAVGVQEGDRAAGRGPGVGGRAVVGVGQQRDVPPLHVVDRHRPVGVVRAPGSRRDAQVPHLGRGAVGQATHVVLGIAGPRPVRRLAPLVPLGTREAQAAVPALRRRAQVVEDLCTVGIQGRVRRDGAVPPGLVDERPVGPPLGVQGRLAPLRRRRGGWGGPGLPATTEGAHDDEEHRDHQRHHHENPEEGPAGATRRRVLATCLNGGRRLDRPPAVTHVVMIWVRWVPVGGS